MDQQLAHMQHEQNLANQQQALMMQYQQQLVQPMVEEQHAAQRSAGLRQRGRAKAYTQSGRQVASASRVPGIAAGSGSRSHGSRKRTQKTRSSLNVKHSLPLSSAGFLGPVPQSLSALPSSLGKHSKKAAAQIYGNSSMLNNITSSKRKTGSVPQVKKALKGKRSQPNQGAKQQFKQMQAQIQA